MTSRAAVATLGGFLLAVLGPLLKWGEGGFLTDESYRGLSVGGGSWYAIGPFVLAIGGAVVVLTGTTRNNAPLRAMGLFPNQLCTVLGLGVAAGPLAFLLTPDGNGVWSGGGPGAAFTLIGGCIAAVGSLVWTTEFSRWAAGHEPRDKNQRYANLFIASGVIGFLMLFLPWVKAGSFLADADISVNAFSSSGPQGSGVVGLLATGMVGGAGVWQHRRPANGAPTALGSSSELLALAGALVGAVAASSWVFSIVRLDSGGDLIRPGPGSVLFMLLMGAAMIVALVGLRDLQAERVNNWSAQPGTEQLG